MASPRKDKMARGRGTRNAQLFITLQKHLRKDSGGCSPARVFWSAAAASLELSFTGRSPNPQRAPESSRHCHCPMSWEDTQTKRLSCSFWQSHSQK